MTQVVSRVNGLKIAIPADARNVIHRFAIAGGGNELVFEPITRKTFDSSKKGDADPLDIMGQGSDSGEVDVAETVELSENVVDEPEKKKTTRKPRKAAAKVAPEAAGGAETSDIL